MTLGLILALAAQAASPATGAETPSAPIATSATASARILRPETFSLQSLEQTAKANPASTQLRVDKQGTPWIEFS